METKLSDLQFSFVQDKMAILLKRFASFKFSETTRGRSREENLLAHPAISEAAILVRSNGMRFNDDIIEIDALIGFLRCLLAVIYFLPLMKIDCKV